MFLLSRKYQVSLIIFVKFIIRLLILSNFRGVEFLAIWLADGNRLHSQTQLKNFALQKISCFLNRDFWDFSRKIFFNFALTTMWNFDKYFDVWFFRRWHLLKFINYWERVRHIHNIKSEDHWVLQNLSHFRFHIFLSGFD